MRKCNNVMKKYITTLIALTTLTVTQAQEIDLNQEAISDLELDFQAAALSNKVAIYADLTYWNFFAVRYRGWNGGDGAYSTTLPDGRTFWSFGSSHFGLVSENRERKHQLNNRPHNAAMIQTGEESEDDFITLNPYVGTSPADLSTYYKGREWIEHPASLLTDEEKAQGLIDPQVYFQLDDATLYRRADKPVLQVLLGGYTADNGRNETALAEFSLEGNPGDNSYMQLTSLRRNLVPYTTDYGHAMLEDDGHVYLFGRAPTGYRFGGYYPVVARTETTSLNSRWEYYIKDADGNWAWQRTAPTNDEMRRSSIIGTIRIASYCVFRYNDTYQLCFLDENQHTIWMMTADTPYGQYRLRKSVYDIPTALRNASRLTVHPQLSRMGELVLSYNVEPTDVTVITKGDNDMAIENLISGDERNFYDWESADLDQTHFLRIFNWQAFYSIENTGPTEDTGMQSYLTTIVEKLPSADSPAAQQAVYDLQGRRLTAEPAKGVYIMNGKKVVK